MADVTIRPYETRDRTAIRHICCETADRGNVVEAICDDRALVADLMTRYFTDHEPQSVWVAEGDGRIVGYLTGTVHPRRYDGWHDWWLVPTSVLAAVCRGVLFRRQTWRLLRATWLTWRRGGFPRHVSTQAYPAHLHVNVVEGFRGQGLGRRLVERFIEQARAAGRDGIHVILREDNQPACGLFERLGFEALGRYPLVLPNGHEDLVTHAIVYGKRL